MARNCKLCKLCKFCGAERAGGELRERARRDGSCSAVGRPRDDVGEVANHCEGGIVAAICMKPHPLLVAHKCPEGFECDETGGEAYPPP